jgi:endonuclease YncB( thermonuclease family)
LSGSPESALHLSAAAGEFDHSIASELPNGGLSMTKSFFAVLAVAIVSTSVAAGEPLKPGYQVGEPLQLLFWEYRVTGPHVEKPGAGAALVCTYSTRPVVMVYTRQINATVIRLIRKLDEATRAHQQERLCSFVVLACDRQDRDKELKALAEKEKIQHTLLSLVVLDEAGLKRFQDKFGAEAETTVIVATSQRQVKASYAYRTGELRDKDIAQILANLPKILPKDDPDKERKSKVVKEQVRGGIVFPAEKRIRSRITGKVKVVNAYTLRFEDGTEVCLGGGIDAPELDQKGLIGGSFYPCGKEAAEFLTKLIGDQTVAFLWGGEQRVGKSPAGSCFVGETNLEIEMVRNGWAFSHHSGMDAWEIIARESQRGLWRGKFVVPERWRKGERLPGE